MHFFTGLNAAADMAEVGKRLHVYGLVQGVFFRAWTRQQAQELGVTGLVRNRSDGSVEVEAFGEAGAVEALIARCRQGPPHARVERIDLGEVEGDAPPDFRVAPTI